MPDARPSSSSNAAHHLADGQVLLRRGRQPAVVDGAGRWTFDALAEASARAGGALADEGVLSGDRVAVALPDGREAAAALIGAMRIGAIAVPLDPGAPAAHLAAAVADCAPSVVVDRPGTLDGGTPRPVAPVRPEDPALIVYTSGTTGEPKGVVHAHRTFSPALPSFLRDVLGVGPGDRVLATARTATALGLFLGLIRPLAAGATAVLSAERTTPRGTLDAVGRDGVTVLAGVPMHWAQIASVLRHDPDRRGALASLRAAVSTGDRCSPGLARETADLGITLIDALGASECGDVYLSGDGDGTLSRVSPGVEVRVGRYGGRTGPLWVRTPCAALGYWRRPELTARLRRGRWTRTEDVVARDGDGLRLLGRADDLFKVSGRLVSPLEIERALAEHPLVREAAVVASAERGRVRPAAFVVTASPPGPAAPGLVRELRRHVARRLSPDLAPGSVAVLETLPRLAGGKLDRRALSAVALP
jgi:4-hydroxybenzoate adenylyltransferase